MRKNLPLLATLVLTALLTLAQTKIVTGRLTDSPAPSISNTSIQLKDQHIGMSPADDSNCDIAVRSERSTAVLICL